MGGDADAVAGVEAAGVTLAPVGPGRAIVQEVCVDVDQHPWLLRARQRRKDFIENAEAPVDDRIIVRQ